MSGVPLQLPPVTASKLVASPVSLTLVKVDGSGHAAAYVGCGLSMHASPIALAANMAGNRLVRMDTDWPNLFLGEIMSVKLS